MLRFILYLYDMVLNVSIFGRPLFFLYLKHENSYRLMVQSILFDAARVRSRSLLLTHVFTLKI